MSSFAPTSDCDLLKKGCVAALGCFDGLHVGHQKLIARAKEIAREIKLPLVVYSPESKKGTAFLTTSDEKRELLLSLGADLVILADFESIRALSPLQFVQDVLIGQLNCQIAVCGYNFTFGNKAAGNAELLCKLMADNNRKAYVESSVTQNGLPVSSTRVRNLLSDGNAEKAALLLSRPYALTSVVTHGRKIGRTLGFPTLNLAFPEGKIIPKKGVYYCRVTTACGVYGAIANVGIRPTFDDTLEKPVLEAHLFNFSGDLYSQTVKVELVRFIRPEQTFPDSTALAAAVHTDIEHAKELAATDPILTKEAL